MQNTEIQDIISQNEAAEIARMDTLSKNSTQSANEKLITAVDSPYREFEISLGTDLLSKINKFLYSQDKSEFSDRPYIEDPLLLICKKVLDWKIEVGTARLNYELFTNHNGEGVLSVIQNAWSQVKIEQEIIYNAKQIYNNQLNSLLEKDPGIASRDPDEWCNLCNGFRQFDALQEFNYPLSFDSIFGELKQDSFNYGVSVDNSNFFEVE